MNTAHQLVGLTHNFPNPEFWDDVHLEYWTLRNGTHAVTYCYTYKGSNVYSHTYNTAELSLLAPAF